MKKHLTTSEVAELLSVTPDAVLKWVKLGKLPAQRTPGGHCRIPEEALAELKVMRKASENQKVSGDVLYCWQFHSQSSTVSDNCKKCVVYRSQTKRCWELQILPTEVGHQRKYCRISCEECVYKQYIFAE